MRVDEIDENFTVKNFNHNDDGVEYFGVDASFVELNGFPWFEKEKVFCRLPQAILPHTNPGVQELAYFTSGGALRFQTNSKEVRIFAELLNKTDMNHMPRTGSSGFDLYVGKGQNKKFINNLAPASHEMIVHGILAEFSSKRMREYTLYFPLYNGVGNVRVGLDVGAEVAAPTSFTIEEPFVFYGASITQGGCSSRPGNAFSHVLSRQLDADFVNLGFSGSARGEGVLAEAINSLSMTALFLDYDQGEIDDLRVNHELFFNRIRESNPELPIFIIAKRDTKPNFEDEDEDMLERIEIIKRTYSHAKQKMDDNVYFIDNNALFACGAKDACTVDGIHPNDYGFMRMANNLLSVWEEVVNR